VSVLPDSAAVAGGRLELGGVAASELAERFGTPLHVYCEQTLRNRASAALRGLELYPDAAVAYACKANSTVGVLRVLFEEGLGADVASAGELAAALRAGAAPDSVVVHGNNKSDDDLAAAVALGAGLIVVDHAGELARLDRIAAGAGRVQRVLVRVTPGIAPDTHAKIVTGHAASKFGFAPADAVDALDAAAGLVNLQPCGLHVHLGSQIRDAGPYLEVVDWLAGFIEDNGLGELPVLDIGGGFGLAHAEGEGSLPLEEGLEAIAGHVVDRLLARGLPLPRLVVEPGRSVVGAAGVTLYRVGAVKQTAAGVVYAAVDGGMSDNPRPALYGARYDAIAADRADTKPDHVYAIAGKHCESGDVLIEEARLPELRPGDVLVVPATGAYAASMASTYNLVPRAASVMVAGGDARLLERRETVDDLLARDVSG
jgi:diaminopimelate decarboxylase